MANTQYGFSLKNIMEYELQSDEERVQFLRWAEEVGLDNLRELHKTCDTVTDMMVKAFRGQLAI